ncbi:facilitated trehalose transporter Tret1-like [Danaus plexippus]|uniref:facilitated trehalose transporter Tret1-like n=1 Tax=Danaus plexippus TaxID=13037 RepID=UPI002AB190F2|nr:facilitated trehalose transporter Tret1-like [Danaus plexippus]
MIANIPPSIIRQYITVVIVNLATLTSGMSIAWPSPVILKLQNGTDTPFSTPITNEESSWTVSGGYLLSITINAIGGILLEKNGRKRCIIMSSLPKFIMAVLCIFLTEVWMLILVRAIWILFDCFTYTIVSVYVSEIASKEHRGSLGSLLQVSSCLGVLITLSVGPFISYTALNTFIATMIALTIVPLFFLPDSPYHLYFKEREEEAIRVLKLIRESDTEIKEELEEYRISKDDGKINKMSLFKDRIFLKSLALGILLCASTNLVGFSAVSYYLQTIFETTNTKLPSEIASVIIGCTQLFAALCTNFASNKFGRRTILLSSLCGIFFGMIGLGTFFKVSESSDYVVSGFMNYLPLISVILVIYFYSAGVGSVFWFVIAELFDSQHRGFGVCLSQIATVLFIFITSKYFPIMTTVMGPVETYFFFAVLCILFGVLIAIFLPETKGKTLQEIQAALGGGNIKKKDQEI